MDNLEHPAITRVRETGESEERFARGREYFDEGRILRLIKQKAPAILTDAIDNKKLQPKLKCKKMVGDGGFEPPKS